MWEGKDVKNNYGEEQSGTFEWLIQYAMDVWMHSVYLRNIIFLSPWPGYKPANRTGQWMQSGLVRVQK